MELYVASQWQAGSTNWYVNNTSGSTKDSGKWWVPARMLGITPAAYVKLLVENYQPDNISFNNNVLIFSWKPEHYTKAHNYKLWINREARKRGFKI